MIGGLVGGAALAGVAVAAVSSLCDAADGCRGDTVQAGLLGGAVGGLAGALVGGGVGWLVSTWRRVHP